MTYLRNLLDLLLAHWLLRNLRRETRAMSLQLVKTGFLDTELFIRKENTIRLLEARVAELEKLLK